MFPNIIFTLNGSWMKMKGMRNRDGKFDALSHLNDKHYALVIFDFIWKNFEKFVLNSLAIIIWVNTPKK